MDTKFLSDGRKVIIVGQINNQETIVQEIFVTKDGDEVPSGERFVVKSLHDEPVESYKAREEKKLITRIKNLEQEIKNIQAKGNEFEIKRKAQAAVLKSNTKFLELFDDQDTDLLADFFTGSIEYVVCPSAYSDSSKVSTFLDHVTVTDNGYYHSLPKYDSIRLLSIFGNSEGDIGYRSHDYYDGSGQFREIYPARNMEEVGEIFTAYAEKRHTDGRLSIDEVIEYIGYGAVIPKDTLVELRYSDITKHKEFEDHRLNEEKKRTVNNKKGHAERIKGIDKAIKKAG